MKLNVNIKNHIKQKNLRLKLTFNFKFNKLYENKNFKF